MNRKIASIIVIIAIITVFSSLEYYFSITGFVASTLSLSIGNYTEGKITWFGIEPYLLDINETVTIHAEFRNSGNVPFNSRMFLEVQNLNHSQICNFTDAPVTLDAGERRHFMVSHVARNTGFNWVLLEVTYADDRSKVAYGLFYVYPIWEEEEEGPSGPGGPDYPLLEELPVEEGLYADFTLEYQDSIILTQGQSTLIPIFVNAIGNTSLMNIKFLGTMVDLPFNVSPQVISILNPGSKGIFLIDLNIPIDADLTTYTLHFDIVASTARKTGNIRIEVRALPLIDQINQTIQNYQYLIRRIKQEIERARIEGKNVTIPEYFILLAENDLNNAISLYNDNRYEEALNKLDQVKNNIINAVLELSILQKPTFIFLIPYYWYIVIVLILLVVFFLLYRRKKRKKEEKKII